MRISDWSSDVCSSDLRALAEAPGASSRRVAGGVDRRAPWTAARGGIGDRARPRRVARRGPAQSGRGAGRGRGGQYVWIAVVARYEKKKTTRERRATR